MLIKVVDDVMAHVHTFGTVAPEAAGIIQWVQDGARRSILADNMETAWVPLHAMSLSEFCICD